MGVCARVVDDESENYAVECNSKLGQDVMKIRFSISPTRCACHLATDVFFVATANSSTHMLDETNLLQMSDLAWSSLPSR